MLHRAIHRVDLVLVKGLGMTGSRCQTVNLKVAVLTKRLKQKMGYTNHNNLTEIKQGRLKKMSYSRLDIHV